jgi:hypothetical protein
MLMFMIQTTSSQVTIRFGVVNLDRVTCTKKLQGVLNLVGVYNELILT